MKRAFILAVASGAICGALPAAAHHSFAMFDGTKTVSIDGTVESFQFTNPHIWVQLRAVDPVTHKIVDWSIEGGTPNSLARAGWMHSSLKAGDKVTILMHPLRAGGFGGSLISASGPDLKLRH